MVKKKAGLSIIAQLVFLLKEDKQVLVYTSFFEKKNRFSYFHFNKKICFLYVSKPYFLVK